MPLSCLTYLLYSYRIFNFSFALDIKSELKYLYLLRHIYNFDLYNFFKNKNRVIASCSPEVPFSIRLFSISSVTVLYSLLLITDDIKDCFLSHIYPPPPNQKSSNATYWDAPSRKFLLVFFVILTWSHNLKFSSALFIQIYFHLS